MSELESTLQQWLGGSRVPRKPKFRICYGIRIHGTVYPVERTKDHHGDVLWKCVIDGEQYDSCTLRYLVSDMRNETGSAELVKEREAVFT